MILTVTLNAAIDRTLEVPKFRPGHRHRAMRQQSFAGGKGVNVARALKRLGRPVIATGLTGGPTGARLLEHLAGESILSDFTQIREETRTNTAVVDPTSGQQTEINERGPAVATEEVELFREKLLYLAQGAELCVIAGSLPPEVDPGLYARLVAELRGLGVSVVLDSYGDSMLLGMRAEPAVVTPNVREAEELVGREFNDGEDLAAALDELIELGAGEAIITRDDGCIALVGERDERRRYEVTIEPLDRILSTVGSGDAFVAGYVAARYDRKPPPECLAYAVACGAESTRHIGAGIVDPDGVEELLERVSVSELQSAAVS